MQTDTKVHWPHCCYCGSGFRTGPPGGLKLEKYDWGRGGAKGPQSFKKQPWLNLSEMHAMEQHGGKYNSIHFT